MWWIYETKEVTKNLKKNPIEIQKKYKAWVEIVKNGGSKNLQNYSGFNDKLLKGKLRECRSSRLNIQYRVIVKEIIVLSVTPHKYEEIAR